MIEWPEDGTAARRAQARRQPRLAATQAGRDAAPADRLRIYLDFRDWWIGYYRSPTHHYVCTDPTVVIRWPRRRR